MDMRMLWCCCTLALFAGFAAAQEVKPKLPGSATTAVKRGNLLPPRVAAPCKPGHCPFAGQTVTVLSVDSPAIGGPVLELKDEFEAATGATLVPVQVPHEEVFAFGR